MKKRELKSYRLALDPAFVVEADALIAANRVPPGLRSRSHLINYLLGTWLVQQINLKDSVIKRSKK